jgi:hypothetical protein
MLRLPKNFISMTIPPRKCLPDGPLREQITPISAPQRFMLLGRSGSF